MNSSKYFPAELPEATGKDVVGDNDKLAGKQQACGRNQVLAIEVSAPAAEERPLVLVIELQDPAWQRELSNSFRQENFS